MEIVNPILVKNKSEQTKTVPLDMGTGDQTVTPDAGKTLSSVTVEKPSSLVSSNIKNGVDIGGVVGDYSVPLEAQKTVSLDMASGDQSVTPTSGYDGMEEVVVEKPATLLPENIKDGVDIGGVVGTYSAPASGYEDLVDGTMTTFSMPQGKTAIKDYLFYKQGAAPVLTYADLTGAETIGAYAFFNCSNAEIVLPTTLINIKERAFDSAGNSSHYMELSSPDVFCSVGERAFYGAYIRKVTGKINPQGQYAFGYTYGLQEIDIDCGNNDIAANAFSGSSTQPGNSFTKLHIKVNGAIGSGAFSGTNYISDLSITGNITNIGDTAFMGLGATRAAYTSVLTLDFSQSTFPTIPSNAFGGTSSTYLRYMDITLPQTLSAISAYAFRYIRDSKIYFTGEAPTIQTTSFGNSSSTTLFVPYNRANEYRTKTNWASLTLPIVAYAAENTFTNGETLPTVNTEGYGLTWYSDEAMTQQITTVTDATQKLYCSVGTTILAYQIKSENITDCTVAFTDGSNTYVLGDMVPTGTSLTVTVAPTDQSKPDAFIFDINGTDYAPALSQTITVSAPIEVIAVFYDGINAPFSRTLNDNSWEQIKTVCDKGLAQYLWTLGDTKTDSTNKQWRLVDTKAGRYEKVGGGSTNAVFELIPTIQFTNWASSTATLYSGSYLYTRLLPGGSAYTTLDQSLATLVTANKITIQARDYDGSIRQYQCGFFAAALAEMGTANYSDETKNGNTQYGSFEYYATDTNNRRKKDYTYWLRTRSDSSNAVFIRNSDGAYNSTTATGSFAMSAWFSF